MTRIPGPFGRLTLPALVLALLVGTVVAGCSSKASTRVAEASGGSDTTAPPVTVPTSIPAGTTLRLGDQLDYLQTILRVSEQDQDLPYKVEYSNFVGGPPMLQAFKGGALDGGFVASTPLLFAQAAGQKITAIAGWAPAHGSAGLLTVDDSINGWGDVKGKRIAYQRGTSLEAGLLVALDHAGLSVKDITTVDVPFAQINATLQSGSADAAISSEPLISSFVATHPEARVAARADDITDRATFLIASADALADPGKTAALADYSTRLVRAFEYLDDHPDVKAQAIYVDQYKLPVDRANDLVAANGPISFLTLPDDIAEAQQNLAKLFIGAGQIPVEIDAAKEFDTRFNDLVHQEAAT